MWLYVPSQRRGFAYGEKESYDLIFAVGLFWTNVWLQALGFKSNLGDIHASRLY